MFLTVYQRDRIYYNTMDRDNEKLKTEGREILEGAVAVNPYKQGNKTACDYCPYHAVCGFDLKTSGFGFRKFKPLKSEEIWPEIEGEQQDGD